MSDENDCEQFIGPVLAKKISALQLLRFHPVLKNPMKNDFFLTLLIVALLQLVSVSVIASPANDWPEFRGPMGQGISNAKNLPISWDSERNVAWKVEVPGKGWSSPVLSNGKIVLTSSKESEDGIVLCAIMLDADTGKIIWEQNLFHPSEEEVKANHSKNSLASGTAIISGNRIYVHFSHMGTAALKFSSGKVVWKQQLSHLPVHGTGGSPVLVNGLLVFNTDGKKDPAIVALSAKSGKLVWRTPRNQEVLRKFSFCTPLVIENQGRTEIVSPASGMVGAYAPEDGKLLWKVSYGEGYSVVPRPVYSDDMLYVVTGFNRPNLLAIRTDGSNGDLTESHVQWKALKNMPKTPSPIVAGGVVYTIDDTGTLGCRDANTGELKWKEKLIGNFSASPVLAGNTLYCCTEDGVCYLLDVSPDGGTIIWETDLEERILASPAVIDGAIYIRSHPHLWKFVSSEDA